MAVADTQPVARLLREYAQRTSLRGGNPYRAKAYARAADSLTALAVPLDVLVEEDRLTEIPGVGEAIADIITKLHRTGSHPSLEKLRKEVPAGVLEMLTIPGLKSEKVMRLHKDLGISSLAELEAAVERAHLAHRATHHEAVGEGVGLAVGVQAHPDVGLERPAVNVNVEDTGRDRVLNCVENLTGGYATRERPDGDGNAFAVGLGNGVDETCRALDRGVLAIELADDLDVVFELGRFRLVARRRDIAFPVFERVAAKREDFEGASNTNGIRIGNRLID